MKVIDAATDLTTYTFQVVSPLALVAKSLRTDNFSAH